MKNLAFLIISLILLCSNLTLSVHSPIRLLQAESNTNKQNSSQKNSNGNNHKQAGPASYDVVVVGAGIAGITAAN